MVRINLGRVGMRGSIASQKAFCVIFSRHGHRHTAADGTLEDTKGIAVSLPAGGKPNGDPLIMGVGHSSLDFGV